MLKVKEESIPRLFDESQQKLADLSIDDSNKTTRYFFEFVSRKALICETNEVAMHTAENEICNNKGIPPICNSAPLLALSYRRNKSLKIASHTDGNTALNRYLGKQRCTMLQCQCPSRHKKLIALPSIIDPSMKDKQNEAKQCTTSHMTPNCQDVQHNIRNLQNKGNYSKQHLVIVMAACLFCFLSYWWLYPRSSFQSSIDLSSVPNGINMSLTHNLFGQKFVANTLPITLTGFLNNPNQTFEMFLLLGPSGSGKTKTSSIIKHHLEEANFDTYEWHLDGSSMPDFKLACGLSLNQGRYKHLAMFVDYVGQSLSDVLQQARGILETKVYRIYKKIILVITSDMFARQIQEFYSNQCIVNGNEVRLEQDMAQMVKKQLTHFIFKENPTLPTEMKYEIFPFLPLEEKYVEMCVRAELIRHGIAESKWLRLTEFVLMELDFYQMCGMRFSQTGCKLIKSRIDYVRDK